MRQTRTLARCRHGVSFTLNVVGDRLNRIGAENSYALILPVNFTGVGNCRQKERRQVHWTRGPGNVPRRTLLTPRNQRDRNLQRPKPSEPLGVNHAVPDSRSPVTPKHVVRRRWSEDPCLKACCSSGRVVSEPHPERKSATIATPPGPFHQLPSARRLTATISQPANWDTPTSKTRLTPQSACLSGPLAG